ncbi:MAG: hypothetical protein HPZ91_18600 [Lentisphaeria bacterium]|nr:hypothetical protein [Lentisphaeria bacterium]
MNLRLLLCALAFGCAVLLPAAAISPYGVCAHLNRMPDDEMKRELAGMADSGIRLVRTDLDWSQVEPEPGKWDFSRWDALVDEAGRHRVGIIAILGGELHKPVRPPYRNMDAFLRYVSESVKRYKGKIACYEVINEADCDRPWGEAPDPEHYAELLKKTYETVKRIDPQAKVLFSGVSFVRNPFPFLEKAFAAGAGDACDAVNFHPYQWKYVPEAQLRNKITELRALMKKYNIDKPVWVTEIGNSSGEQEVKFVHDTIAAALKELGIDPAKRTVGLIRDDGNFYYADGIHMRPEEYLPEAKQLRRLKFVELAALDVSACPVLILPGVEGFPVRQFGFVRDYVERGGTLIVPGGIPFYFNVEKQPNGMFTNAWLTRQCPGELHFGWEASWTRPGVPANATKLVPGEAFPGLSSRQFWTGRFLTAENLKGNDRMIPLFYGVKDDYKAPVAALYRFDSDLKGNLILIPGVMNECSSEEMQAALLARQYLLLLAENVEGICYYRYRAGEWNRGREAHFGIVRRNFEPKPAAAALETLIRLRPDGSGPVAVSSPAPGIRTASWRQPGGETVCAVWSLSGKRKMKAAGTAETAVNCLGAEVKLDGGEFEASPAPLYFRAAGATPEFLVK